MIILDILFFILYELTCFACLRLAKREFRSQISITSIFTLPYLCICTIQEIFCIAFDFFDIPVAEYWLINIVFIVLTFFTEVLLSKIGNNKCSINNSNFERRDSTKITSFFHLSIAAIILYAIINSILSVSNIDISMLLQDEFQDDFGESAGGNFYIRLVTIILAVYLLGFGRTKMEYFFGALCFIPHLIVNTKGVLFIPIIATIIIRVLSGRVKNLKKTFFLIGIFGTIIFFFSYLLENIIYSEEIDSDRLLFLCEKMIVYVLAGVQEFSVNVRDHIVHNEMLDNITMAPIINIFSKFGVGESISNVNKEFFRTIGHLPHYGIANSNVNGYIGTLYIFNGFLGALFYHVVLIVITFCIKLKCNNHRPFWSVLYALYLSGFFLGWFEFYFMHTFWVYFILLIIIFDIFYKYCNKLSGKNEK